MGKVRVVEVIQWTGKNLRAVIDMTGTRSTEPTKSWFDYEKTVKEHGLKLKIKGVWHNIKVGGIVIREGKDLMILNKEKEPTTAIVKGSKNKFY